MWSNFGQFDAICMRQSSVTMFMHFRNADMILAIKEKPFPQQTVERHKHMKMAARMPSFRSTWIIRSELREFQEWL